MSTDAGAGGDRPTREVTIAVNGEDVTAQVEPRLKLADFLRREGYQSVRLGCEHGACGACIVRVDGDAVKSCLQYAVQADGRAVETVEGLAEDGELHPIQASFREAGALQCGFCTSGFLMATRALLAENPDPTDEEIARGLAGNLCRCTGYRPMYEAVHAAAERMD